MVQTRETTRMFDAAALSLHCGGNNTSSAPGGHEGTAEHETGKILF